MIAIKCRVYAETCSVALLRYYLEHSYMCNYLFLNLFSAAIGDIFVFIC